MHEIRIFGRPPHCPSPQKRWMQMKYRPSAASFLGWREVYFYLGANVDAYVYPQTPLEKNDIYGAVNWEAGACVCEYPYVDPIKQDTYHALAGWRMRARRLVRAKSEKPGLLHFVFLFFGHAKSRSPWIVKMGFGRGFIIPSYVQQRSTTPLQIYFRHSV